MAGVTVTLASASRLWVAAAQCQHPSKPLAPRCTQDPYQTWLGARNIPLGCSQGTQPRGPGMVSLSRQEGSLGSQFPSQSLNLNVTVLGPSWAPPRPWRHVVNK